MNLFCVYVLLFFSTFSFGAATTKKQDTKKIFQQLKLKLKHYKKIKYSVSNYPVLLENLLDIANLVDESKEHGFLGDREVRDGLLKIYETAIDKIVPEIFSYKDPYQVSLFATNLIALNAAYGADWKWSSSILVKTCQLLFSRSLCQGNDKSISEMSNMLQKEFISQIKAEDIPQVLNFFINNFDIMNYNIPYYIYEANSCGQLTAEMKREALIKILTKFEGSLRVAVITGAKFEIDLGYFRCFLSNAVFLDLDYQIIELTYDIIMLKAAYCLNKFKFNEMFLIVKHALLKITGMSVLLIIDIFFEPNFGRRIAKNWNRLSDNHLKVWETAVLYIYTNDILDISKVLEGLEDPYKELFVATAEKLSYKIDLVRKASKKFDGSDFAVEIERLFEIYNQDEFKDLPLETSVNILKRLLECQEVYEGRADPLQLFAVVLSFLVYTKHFNSIKVSSFYFFSEILNLAGLQEVPERWKDKFEQVLHEQLPTIVKILSESEITFASEDLLKGVQVIFNYAPELATDLVSSIVLKARSPEEVLNSFTSIPELYQAALLETLTKNVTFNPRLLLCSSSISDLMILLPHCNN